MEGINDATLEENDGFAFDKDVFVSSFGVKEIQVAMIRDKGRCIC